jgi:hypothetical protein
MAESWATPPSPGVREAQARVSLPFHIDHRGTHDRAVVVYKDPQFSRPATLEEMLLWDELQRVREADS